MTEDTGAIPTIFATRAYNNLPMRAQIPKGLTPGDSFTVTPTNGGGSTFNVVVPAGSAAGDFIDIVIPEESEEDEDSDVVTLRSCGGTYTKTSVGAALAGGLLGTLLMGPIVGVLLAGGAAYATTRSEGTVGEHARSIGDYTFRQASMARKWTEAEVTKLYNRGGPAIATPVP